MSQDVDALRRYLSAGIPKPEILKQMGLTPGKFAEAYVELTQQDGIAYRIFPGDVQLKPLKTNSNGGLSISPGRLKDLGLESDFAAGRFFNTDIINGKLTLSPVSAS